MAQPNPKTKARKNSKANVRISRDQWFDQVLNHDGGAALIEKLGFEPQNRKKQGEDQSISFICKNGTYIFTKWNESDASGNAIRFFQFVNNLSDWKQSVWAISELLGIESYIYSKNKDYSVNFSQKILRKADKKEKKIKQVNYEIVDLKIQFKTDYTQEELNYWINKTSCKNIGLLKLILVHNGIKSTESAQITIKYENNDILVSKQITGLNCVFAIETLAGINEYRIIQPKHKLGKGYFLWSDKNKRFFFPNLEKTKKAEPSYQFSMGVNSPKDLSKHTIWASGESDYLTLIAHGYQAVCLGGEGQKFNEYSLAIMRKNGYSPRNLSILFDNDSNKAGFKPEKDKNTGLEFAKKLSLAYKIPYLSIPNFKNSDIKDVSDFFAIGFDKGEDNKQWFEKYILNLPNFETTLGNQKLFCKNDQYFSRNLFAVKTIKKNILAGANGTGSRFIHIDAAAGSGKTHFFLNDQDHFWNDPEIQKIFETCLFAVPTATLALQTSKKYKTEVLCQGVQIHHIHNYKKIVSTYESAHKINYEPSLFVIDEFHMTTNDFWYRKKTMKRVAKLAKIYPNAVFVFLTATPSKSLMKTWEKMNGKMTKIRIETKEKNNYTLQDASFSKGTNKENRENTLLASLMTDFWNGQKSMIHINSKNQIHDLMLKLEDMGVPRKNMDYFVSKKWKINTESMESIIDQELIPDHVKILFCTNAIVQGINIKNEGKFNLYLYDGRNNRLTTKNVIQVCNRFRQAKADAFLMYAEVSEQRNPLNQQIESLTKRSEIEKMAENLNKLKGNDFVKLESQMKKIRESYDIHALELTDYQYHACELYFAAENERIDENCLSTENYIKEIIKTGRGIGFNENFNKADRQIQLSVERKSSNIEISLHEKLGREDLKNELLDELGIDPQPLLKLVSENTKDEPLKKKINYFLLGTDRDSIPNTKVLIDPKSITAVDIAEKNIYDFLDFWDLTQKSYQEVSKILKSCQTPRQLKKQRQFFVLENMHHKDSKDDFFSKKDFKNMVEFQKIAEKITSKHLSDFGEIDRTVLREDLFCASKQATMRGRTFSRYDCIDLFDNLFEYNEDCTVFKDLDGSRKRKYLLSNLKARYAVSALNFESYSHKKITNLSACSEEKDSKCAEL